MTQSFLGRTTSLLLLALVQLALSGCGILVTANASHQYSLPDAADPRTVGVYGRSDESAETAAARFATMALFSQAVYRDDLPRERRWADARQYLAPGATVPRVGMPHGPEGRWSRWTGSPVACKSEAGLVYETYVFTNASGVIEKAVIAFRGTENEGAERLYDWSANLMAAFGTEPHQYKIAQGAVKQLVKDLVASSHDVKIFATGHSLGGGLAQQAGYLSRRVQESSAPGLLR